VKFPHQDTLKRWFQTHNTPVFVQFVKYGLCGVASTIILLAIAMALSNTMIPAMNWSIIEGQPITDAQRQRNLIINNLIAFPFANHVNYLLNARLVFVPGRHSRTAEFSLFTSIAGFGFLVGLLGGPFLIRGFGLSSVLAQFMLIGTSALVNFLCRKFLVFVR
tara:strand:+ start:1874 stop:2362 length:489 start_codon:yes stop_codon:yes gene_type:complete